VPAAVRSLSVSPVRTSFESPWQNEVAERWVGSCRRDLLDHIIAVDERHLKRLLSEYIRYYHEDRTHLALGKGTPDGRTSTISSGRVLSHARLVTAYQFQKNILTCGMIYSHHFEALTACATAIKRIHFFVLLPSVNFQVSSEECLDAAPAKVFIEQAELSVAGRAHPVQKGGVSFEIA
jgi:hypothetical protein